jgi:hypothetical protein
MVAVHNDIQPSQKRLAALFHVESFVGEHNEAGARRLGVEAFEWGRVKFLGGRGFGLK